MFYIRFGIAEIQTAAEIFKITFHIYASSEGNKDVYVFCTRQKKHTLKLTLSVLDISDDGDDNDSVGYKV